MSILEIASRKGFVVTAELTPPKGPNFAAALMAAEEMLSCVDAVNVTDGQSAVMRMGSLALSHLLIERGIEPVFQLTCRDRNRIALQSELLSAYGLGIRNVLCITGDHVALGDHPDAKQVFDLDSVSLLWAVRQLNEGRDLGGNALKDATDLCAGAVVNPNASSVEAQLLKMKRKIEAGARFFQTQALFEVHKLEPFAKLAQDMKVTLLMGILILRNPNMARYVKEHVSGVRVPDELVIQIENSSDPTKAGVEIAARLATEAKEVCQGIHIMAGGKADLVRQVLEAAGLR